MRISRYLVLVLATWTAREPTLFERLEASQMALPSKKVCRKAILTLWLATRAQPTL
ncbi:hypothetical protein [Telluribacter sp.]|uniref:hypothetical protein n=1 Tax=Telluribacter sp. TaxID=1978767 RepID=UPI002E116D0D|nr:hypothetical protein [Telluribacter sp.]